ncbi:hypothetical protein OIDMADRAFT_60364 [Oidiodendron maius Zn]|uniref:AMP-dependent synthetase/ligase domain-containing protein n=1 Tax=Oidiodendron maius (strain Zn) TaxID=913774 RepID=A0A0C3C6S9_OIDMZ|nr:hypothetical protein OIDMADRAFT_60364 [Oidiodendron maius Zn]
MTKAIYAELPNEPTFVELLRVFRQVHQIIVHDPQNGVDADYSQFFTDLLRMREILYESLPKDMFDEQNIIREESPYVFILSRGDYEFIIASFAILSIGGALVPLSTEISPEEASQLLHRCKSTTILAGQDYLQLAAEVKEHAASHDLCVTVLPISIKVSPVIDPHSGCVKINPDMRVESHRPGVLLFTSGTSGPPKAVVHTRAFNESHTKILYGDVFLSHRPPHWISGMLPLISLPLRGARLEVTSSNPSILWERLKTGGVTILAGTPYIWTPMMKYFDDHLSCLPLEKLNAYIRGAQGLRVAYVTGSMPHPSLLRFWRGILGQKVKVAYGATEFGGYGTCTTDDTDENLELCIGRPLPGVTIHLSEGDHGEILIKSPSLFSHYLGDEAATRAAFSIDGFYRSGDLAHRIGDDYILDGRASGDFIKCQGYKVQILKVEQALKDLPFISEGCILQVPDSNNSGRVAALVRFEDSVKAVQVGCHGSFATYLQFLREHLARTLPAYMLPTVLRILQDGEEIPQTVSNKVIRKKAVDQYFPLSKDSELPTDVELWDPETCHDNWIPRAWDWAGLQTNITSAL